MQIIIDVNNELVYFTLVKLKTIGHGILKTFCARVRDNYLILWLGGKCTRISQQKNINMLQKYLKSYIMSFGVNL